MLILLFVYCFSWNQIISNNKDDIEYYIIIYYNILSPALPTDLEKAPTVKHSSSGFGFLYSLSLPSKTLARLDFPDPVGPNMTNLGEKHEIIPDRL